MLDLGEKATMRIDVHAHYLHDEYLRSVSHVRDAGLPSHDVELILDRNAAALCP